MDRLGEVKAGLKGLGYVALIILLALVAFGVWFGWEFDRETAWRTAQAGYLDLADAIDDSGWPCLDTVSILERTTLPECRPLPKPSSDTCQISGSTTVRGGLFPKDIYTSFVTPSGQANRVAGELESPSASLFQRDDHGGFLSAKKEISTRECEGYGVVLVKQRYPEAGRLH